MRIVSYNILDGGTGRADLLGRVIEQQNPDVVGLVEAEDASVVTALANRLGMDFIRAEGNKSGSASALLSRFPICQSINHAPQHPALTKSLLEATIVDPSGTEWILGVLHLHARAAEADEDVREREIAQVLEIFRPHRESNRPHVLMGDFNANAPYQSIEPSLCKMSTRKAWYANGGKLPRRAIARVIEAGYSDSLRVVHPLMAETAGSFSTESPGQRVDYLFTFGIDAARFKQGRVIYDEPAKDASDHYPIFCELT